MFRPGFTSPYITGAYIKDAELSFCFVDTTEKINKITCKSALIENPGEIDVFLRNIRDQYKLKKSPLYLVLPSDSYQVVLIDKPDVKPSEYNAASLWQAKDMISFPIENVAVDTFLPSPEITIHHDKLYLVATNKKHLFNLVHKIDLLEMPVASVITEEFALRNIVHAAIQDQTAGILTFDGYSYMLTIIGHGDILFFRRTQSKIVDELYRSLDFYTVILKQQRLTSVYIEGLSEGIKNEINTYFSERNYELKLEPLKNLISNHVKDPSHLQLKDIFAIGGLLESVNTKEHVYAEN